MDTPSLEELVRSQVHLPNRPSAQGWYPVLCKVCNDHGNKGPRAAFRFDNGGVGYHCFNCSIKGAFSDDSKTISKELEEILLAYGVQQDDIAKIRFALMGKKYEESKEEKKRTVVHEPKELPLPTHFKTLDYDSVWCEVAREYLADRLIDPDSYPFMISTGVCEDLAQHPNEVQFMMASEAKKWVGRAIIPIYKDNKLVFYTGRDMTGEKIKKYETPSSGKHNVVFGFDELFKHTDRPLYVVEGIMDAFIVGGVAVLGNKFTESQQYWLNRSNRQKVYIPDRFGDGHINAITAVRQGWSVAFPEIGNCKDINSAAQTYGKLYVLTSINQNTASGFGAEARIGLYCKDDKRSN